MNELYKSLFLNKISKSTCFVTYKNSGISFERPFKFINVKDDFSVVLLDCVTGKEFVMYLDDVLMFRIEHEDDHEKSELDLSKGLAEYTELASKLTFLRGRRLNDLFFRSDIVESKPLRIRHIKILDALRLDDLDDYTKLISNDREVIDKLKDFWYKLIIDRYNKTIEGLEEEAKNAIDKDTIEELNSIKEILSSIPAESKEELYSRNDYVSILEYWPTLLLPRNEIFDIS